MMKLILVLGLGIALAPGNAVAEKVVIGTVPLVTAARAGDLAEVRRRLLTGVNPNKAALDGITALMQGAMNGRADIAITLVKFGARIDAKDRSGNTALVWAAERGSALLVTLLADAGADIDTTDQQGMSALMKAAMGGHEKAVATLITLGANVEFSDFAGMTALAWARRQGHWPVVRRLRLAGARITLR